MPSPGVGLAALEDIMATKKKQTENQKARSKALEEMKETLRGMEQNAETVLESIREMLDADSPDEIVDLADGDFEGYAQGIVDDAKNLVTVEFPEDDSDDA
jgi:protein subunit release factor A